MEGIKVLLIDDDTVVSKATSMLLEKTGFSVDVRNGGKNLSGEEVSEKYDVVLLDIEMPEISGIEALEQIRKDVGKNLLPVIMVTSIEGGDSIVEALEKGANDYVTKPVNIDVLNARITTQLELQKLSLEFAKMKELAALNAMITTYNHEINNPLTIAFGMMEKLGRDEGTDQATLEKLKKSIDRVSEIVKKISLATEGGEVNFDRYVKDAKMIKL